MRGTKACGLEKRVNAAVALSALLVAMSMIAPLQVRAEDPEGGHPPVYVNYVGGDIFNLRAGWNVITFWCNPLSEVTTWPSGTTMTAKWVTDNAYSAWFGHDFSYNGHCIRWVVKYGYGTQMTYDCNLPDTNNFAIEGGQAYSVYVPFCDDVVIPIPGGVCPRYWQTWLLPFTDCYVGPYYSGFQMYPPPPDPYLGQTYGMNASDVWSSLKNANGSPYTGTGAVSCWNQDTQGWQMYQPTVPGTDFVIWAKVFMPCGWVDEPANPHDGWVIYLTGPPAMLEGYCY
jgi:hypothetical protein